MKLIERYREDRGAHMGESMGAYALRLRQWADDLARTLENEIREHAETLQRYGEAKAALTQKVTRETLDDFTRRVESARTTLGAGHEH